MRSRRSSPQKRPSHKPGHKNPCNCLPYPAYTPRTKRKNHILKTTPTPHGDPRRSHRAFANPCIAGGVSRRQWERNWRGSEPCPLVAFPPPWSAGFLPGSAQRSCSAPDRSFRGPGSRLRAPPGSASPAASARGHRSTLAAGHGAGSRPCRRRRRHGGASAPWALGSPHSRLRPTPARAGPAPTSWLGTC